MRMTLSIQTELRRKQTKGHLRKLREDGMIPGIVYGKGVEPIPITVPEKQLRTIMRQAVIALDVPGLGKKQVVVDEAQKEAITGQYRHIDFRVVQMDEPIRSNVPVRFVGTPNGVKEGGIRTVLMDVIELRCTPAQMPEAIEVDITHLGIGESIPAGELVLPEGAELLTDSDATLVTIGTQQHVVESTTETEESAAASE